MTSRIVLGVVCATLMTTALANEWMYTIRPGDELWNVAAKYCGSPSYATRLAAHNNLSDPRTVRPGTRLRIPIEWLVRQPVEATVVSVMGTAYLYDPKQHVITVGQRVAMGQTIETTADGSVAVEFADQSVLMIAPESAVLFNVLTAYGDTGMVDTNLRFYRGRGSSKIIRRQGASSFRISTPSGTAAVRGTEFRVGVQTQASITETLSGSVGFVMDTEIPIPGGFGLAASERGVTKEQLLPAPDWISRPGAVAPGHTLRWRPLAAAVAYRVAVYPAHDVRTMIASSETIASEFAPPALVPGNYVVAVRARSAAGIEGFEARLAVSLRNAAPATKAGNPATPGSARIDWEATAAGPPYLVELAPPHSGASADFGSATAYQVNQTFLTLGDLLPGRYAWRVRDNTSVFSEGEALIVKPQAVPEVSIDTHEKQLDLSWPAVAHADGYRVRISRRADFTITDHIAEVEAPAATLNLSQYGTHFVEVSAVAAGVQSDPLHRQVELTAKPLSWLWSLLILPLLVL